MFKKRWSYGAKGKKKKAKEESDDEGDFGAELGDEEFEVSSSKRALPFVRYKGPNAITFQLSGPHTFAVVGRNKKIREELSRIAGARQGTCGPFQCHSSKLYD